MATVRVTAPLHGRIVVRAPFHAGMRTALAAATGARPEWESAERVWTLPRRALAPAAEVVACIFGAAHVAEEIPAPRSGTSDWIHYELSARGPA